MSAPGPDQALSVRVACGVPEEEDLWIATWLFQSPLSSRTSGAHDPAGYGFSGLLGEIRRARAEYARLREAGEVGS